MSVCYIKQSNDSGKPCHRSTLLLRDGPVVQHCCAIGDTCGAHGFCRFTHNDPNTVSGFYLAGCTDKTLSAPACPQHCTEYESQDVVYNATDGLWACCWGSGYLNCGDPSAEAFYAPPPNELFASRVSSSTATSTAAASTSTTSTSSTPSNRAHTSATERPSSHPKKSSQTSTHSSTTTIVVATVIPVVAVLLAIALFLWWRKKGIMVDNRQSPKEPTPIIQVEIFVDHVQGAGYAETAEVPGERYRAELGGMSKPVELHERPILELNAT